MTARQKEVVLALINEGTIKGAAQRLKLSDRTIEFHLNSVKKELRIVSLIHIALWAVKNGIVTL